MADSSVAEAGMEQFYASPNTLSPLPGSLKLALVGLGTTGLISTASCVTMLIFIIYRFITWRSHYKTFVGYNQYVALIVHLLIADMLQGISFMISLHWAYAGGITAQTSTCFSQGMLLNVGDLASGFFVLGVALHTYYGAVHGKHAGNVTFYVLLYSVWIVSVFLSCIGPMMHTDRYYARAGAWCWASMDYEPERLAFHYVWIFFVQFGVVILYAIIFIHLKKSLRQILPSSQSSTHAKVDRAAKLMVLFPAAYILLTLPLSVGRMYASAHPTAPFPASYAYITGTTIASTGFVDCLLYTLTRRSLLRQNTQGGSASGKSVREISKARSDWRSSTSNSIMQTRTVTVTDRKMSVFSDDRKMSMFSDDSTLVSSKRHSLAHPFLGRGRQSVVATSPVSPRASLEWIESAGVHGPDPRLGMKVEICATKIDIEEVSEKDDYLSAEDASRIQRTASPHIRRPTLSLFRGRSFGSTSEE